MQRLQFAQELVTSLGSVFSLVQSNSSIPALDACELKMRKRGEQVSRGLLEQIFRRMGNSDKPKKRQPNRSLNRP